MSIYKKLSKLVGNKSIEEKLYDLLQTDTYKSDVYQYRDLGEGMAVLHKNFWGWYKPWMVLNHNKKTAFEFMDESETLVTVTENDIDWKSLRKLPDDAIMMARHLSFHFPSFIRGFKNGVAQVDWQLNPDGRYYMDDDGYGMTPDVEIEIYGFIDIEGRVLVKFQCVDDRRQLEKLRQEAEKNKEIYKNATLV